MDGTIYGTSHTRMAARGVGHDLSVHCVNPERCIRLQGIHVNGLACRRLRSSIISDS